MTGPDKRPKPDPLHWPLYRVLRAASLLSRYSLKYTDARALLRSDVVRLQNLIATLLKRLDDEDACTK